MGISQSTLFDLIGFLETGGGARLVTLCGPTSSTRLAITCQQLASARAPWVSWEALKYGCAELAAQAELESISAQRNESSNGGPFSVEQLTALLSEKPELLPEPDLLRALCRICGSYGQGSPAADVALGLDELCIALSDGRASRPLLLWTRALRKPGLTALLEKIDAKSNGLDSQVVETGLTPCSSGDLFDALLGSDSGLGARFSRILQLLVTGVDLSIKGPKVLNGDPGCCHWNALSAAAHVSNRWKSGPCVVALLLAARAHADACCPGPCHLSPLMHAAQANAPQVCKMLVLAHADPRRRHAGDGNTALDMANKETARAIKEAREQRNVEHALQAGHDSTSEPVREAPGRRGRGRGYSPNLAALAFAKCGRGQSRRGA